MTYLTIENTAKRPGVRFWNRIANYYAKSPIADEASYQRKLQITREYLRPDMNVLEFGCGTGSTAILHAPFVDQITAIDISPNMIEIAKNKAAAEKISNISFEIAAVEEIEAQGDRFDAVLGLSILHLLQDQNRAIRDVHRALEPGGVFISSTACLADNMNYFRPIAYIGRILGLMPLVCFFKAKDLEENLINAGFTIEHIWHPGKSKAVFIVAKKQL